MIPPRTARANPATLNNSCVDDEEPSGIRAENECRKIRTGPGKKKIKKPTKAITLGTSGNRTEDFVSPSVFMRVMFSSGESNLQGETALPKPTLLHWHRPGRTTNAWPQS